MSKKFAFTSPTSEAALDGYDLTKLDTIEVPRDHVANEIMAFADGGFGWWQNTRGFAYLVIEAAIARARSEALAAKSHKKK